MELLKDSRDSAQLQRFLGSISDQREAAGGGGADRRAEGRSCACQPARQQRARSSQAEPRLAAGRTELAAPTMLAQYEKWGAYVGAENGIKVCYALSGRTAPTSTPRNAVAIRPS